MDQPGRGGWTLAVHIGLKNVHTGAVAAFLKRNSDRLSQRGAAVVELDKAALQSSIASAASLDAPLVVASAPWLLDLSSGRIRGIDRHVREHGGTLVVVCVIAPASTLALRRYVRRLNRGATRRPGRVVLKRLNYVPSIRRWDEVIGPSNVRLRASAPTGTAASVVSTVAEALSIDIHGLALPSGGSGVRLTGPTAEALRLVNVALDAADDRVDASTLRRVAVRVLRDSARVDDPPLTLPPEAARHLDRIILAGMPDLATRLPADQHALLVKTDPPLVGAPTAERLGEIFERLSSRPRLADVLPEDPMSLVDPEDARQNLRLDLTTAWAKGRDVESAHLSRELRAQISSVPGFVLTNPESGASIPRRLVQYWEPLPLPEYMVPWVGSWAALGMAGASSLVSRDEAREVVGEAAGDRGRQAFDLTVHPAQRSDLFRYASLAVHGGWYVDADHEALAPHDLVLTWPVEHVFVVRKGHRYPNGFLGAVRGSPVMAESLHRACDNLISSAGSMPTMLATGPSMFRDVVVRYLAGTNASAVTLPNQVAFGGLLQTIHNDAPYKVLGHWRDA